MREQNKALFSPEVGAPLERIACDNDAIFACKRTKEGRWYTNSVIAVMNMSDQKQTVTLETGETYELGPWKSEILFKKGRSK